MKIAWIAAAVLLALGLGLKFGTIPKPVAAGPLRTVTFADGGELEIIGVSVERRVIEIVPQPRFKVRFFNSKGSSGGYYGGMSIDTEKESGKVIRTSVHTESPGAMLMEFRLKNRGGTGMKLPSHLARHRDVFQDDRIGRKSAPHRSFAPKDDRVETLVAAMAKADLQLLVQHRDPHAGWIHLNGPALFHEPWPDRYIVALDAWRRDLPDLEFRAIRADGQVAEFSLANPDYRKSPAAGTTTPLPLVHNGGDYTLTLRQVDRFATPGNHSFASPEMELRQGNKPMQVGYHSGVTLNGGAAEDEWGNRVKFEPQTVRKQDRLGAFLPSASKRMTVHLTVARTVNSPRFHYSGFAILEGVVSADGLTVNFTPGADAALLGITTMPVGTIGPITRGMSESARKDWKMLTFPVSGRGNRLSEVENRVGDIFQMQFLFFPGGGNESAGIIPGPTGGGGGKSGDQTFNIEGRIQWLAPPEMLRPEAKLRVGAFRPPSNDDLTFHLELPEQVQPRN